LERPEHEERDGQHERDPGQPAERERDATHPRAGRDQHRDQRHQGERAEQDAEEQRDQAQDGIAHVTPPAAA